MLLTNCHVLSFIFLLQIRSLERPSELHNIRVTAFGAILASWHPFHPALQTYQLPLAAVNPPLYWLLEVFKDSDYFHAHNYFKS